MSRGDGREQDEMREVSILPHYVKTAFGSCLISTGGTRVICTASVEEGVPPFLRGKGEGWVTAEYAMLPASTGRRKARDGVKKDGRGVEIGRLIGRSLRQAVDRTRMGEYTITIDCDVLEADGGTRTASITGGYVALALAVQKMLKTGMIEVSPLTRQIAAVSAGIVEGEPALDLCYIEDSAAQADVNMVFNERGEIIEIQGTGEGRAFTRAELAALLALGEKGARELMQKQREILGESPSPRGEKPALVIASNNAHKIAEIRAILDDDVVVLSLSEAGVELDVEESGATFAENAVIKAECVSRKTGLPTLADDSGLTVDALGGAPGVRSARYAGDHGRDGENNALLIKNLEGVPLYDRTAQFVCAMALAAPGRETTVETGVCPGVITFEPRGEGGFGYDPYFEYVSGETFAEMPAEEKNRVSHRASALRRMLPRIEEILS